MATANFLRAWQPNAGRMVIGKIILPRISSGTDTIYVSNGGVQIAGQEYQNILTDVQPVRSPGGFMASDVALCTGGISLALDSFLGINKTVRDSLLSHRWLGASVSLWFWEDSLVAFSDAEPLLINAVVVQLTIEKGNIVLPLRQSAGWNGSVNPVVVEVSDNPNAPDHTVGVPIPIYYGRHLRPPAPYPWQAVAPWTAQYGPHTESIDLLAGGSAVGKAVLVDTGRGGTKKAKVQIASHKCKTIALARSGCPLFVEHDGEPILIDPVPDGYNTFNDPVLGAGWNIDDGYARFWIPVPPSDVGAPASPAQNSRVLLDRFNMTRFARIDTALGAKDLTLLLGNVKEERAVFDGVVVIGYESSSTFAGYRIIIDNPTDWPGASQVVVSPLPASTTPFFRQDLTGFSGWNTGIWPKTPWMTSNLRIRLVETTPGVSGVGWANIFYFGFALRVSLQEDMVESARAYVATKTRPRRYADHGPHSYQTLEFAPPVTELRGKFWACVEGWADDGEIDAAGTYTGVSGAVIERAPDIITHVLRKYGGISLARIERGVGALGSMVDARAKFTTYKLSDMVFAFSVDDADDVRGTLSRLAANALSWVVISPRDDKFKVFAWKRANNPFAGPVTPTFTRPVSHYQLTAPIEWESTADSRIVTGVRMPYLYDASKGTYLSEVALSADRASAGHEFFGISDEQFSVVAVKSDKLDLLENISTSRIIALTPGTYSVEGYLSMLGTALNAGPSTFFYTVGCGATIVAALNDTLAVNRGTTDVLVTVAPGRYPYMEWLATGVQTAINNALTAAGQGAVANVTATYSRATRLFTLSVPSGTFTLKFSNSGLVNQRANISSAIGMANTSRTGATSYASEGVCEEGLISIAHSGQFDGVMFRTGANGSESATPRAGWESIGFPAYRDSLLGFGFHTTHRFVGVVPKGDRTMNMLTAALRYIRADATGPARKETVIEGRAIRDTPTALEARNRGCDLLSEPVFIARFSAEKLTDIERGATFQFDADNDAFEVYPDPDSDGVLSTKVFTVVEIEQRCGPLAMDAEVVAVCLA